MKVIITDAQFRKAFDATNIVRHLGHDVIPTHSKTGIWQWLKAFFGFPEPAGLLRFESPVQFETDLDKIVLQIRRKDANAIVVMIPCEENTVEFLAQHEKTLDQFSVKMLIPDSDSFATVVDKGNLMKHCLKVGVDTPLSYCECNEMRTALSCNTEQSWVLKPRRGTGAQGVKYFNSGVSSDVLDRLKLEGQILQEKIPSDYGVRGGFFLCNHGSVVGFYAHERVRTYPEEGGVTVLSKCINDPELKEVGCKLLGSLNWNGFAMIECIRDNRDGKLKVIEVNPRLWGSILLGEFSGAALIRNYLNLAEGKEIQPIQVSQDVWIRWVFPYDFMLLLKKKGKLADFWKRDERICYICKTYASWPRSVAFQFLNIVDPSNINKFLKRMVSRG